MEETKIKISPVDGSHNLVCSKCGSRCRKNHYADYFECVNCGEKESGEKIRLAWSQRDVDLCIQREAFLTNISNQTL